MKKFKLELHHKIIIALVLGAIFGAVFNVDQKSIDISSLKNNNVEKERISNWDSLLVVKSSDSSVVRSFKSNEQIKIIKFFKKNSEKVDLKYIAYINGQVKPFFNISSISKPTTIATQIKPIGDLFIRLLSFLAIPLVLASLIVGAASLEDINKLGKIGLKTFVLFIVTTAIAIVIGLILANFIQPGNRISPDAKERLMGTYAEETTEKIQKNVDIDLIDFVITIVPKNPIEALAKGDMLQIVFFAVLLGITLTFLKKEFSDPLINFFT
jgi:Na+/H+-dicarboxylate symporter